MLVSIALTAATICTALTCTKHLDETQWPEIWDETYWAETETRPEMHQFETEMRTRHWGFCPRRDRDETLVCLETISWSRRLDQDHIPAMQSVFFIICLKQICFSYFLLFFRIFKHFSNTLCNVKIYCWISTKALCSFLAISFAFSCTVCER